MNWAQIKDTPYDVSDTGLVRSRERTAKNKNGLRRVRERLLKPGGKLGGYPTVVLSRDGKLTTYAVHRLVAEAFVANPDNKPCVNHKNGLRNDNAANNLEWCDYAENNLHAFRVLNRAPVRVFRQDRPNNRITAEVVDQARAMRKNGATLAQIADATGMSTSSAHRITR